MVFACRIKRDESCAIRDAIRDELTQIGCLGSVRFMERVLDMPALVGAVDVVVMPAESLFAKMDAPLVLLEAMSQNVPLVLADVPPLNEILAFGAGLGVPPRDPEALAQAVAQLIEGRGMREALGRAGRVAVQEVFSPQTMTTQIEAIYDEVLSQ